MGCALPLSCIIHALGQTLKYFKDKCLKETQTKTQTPTSFPSQKRTSEKAKKKKKNHPPNNSKLMEINVLI